VRNVRAAVLPQKGNQSRKRPSVLQSSSDVIAVGEHTAIRPSEKQAGSTASGMTAAANWQESCFPVGPLPGEGAAGVESRGCRHWQETPHWQAGDANPALRALQHVPSDLPAARQRAQAVCL
jgi:hypothetical protein